MWTPILQRKAIFQSKDRHRLMCCHFKCCGKILNKIRVDVQSLFSRLPLIRTLTEQIKTNVNRPMVFKTLSTRNYIRGAGGKGGPMFSFINRKMKQWIFFNLKFIDFGSFSDLIIPDFFLLHFIKKTSWTRINKCAVTKVKVSTMFAVHRTCNWDEVNICWVF